MTNTPSTTRLVSAHITDAMKEMAKRLCIEQRWPVGSAFYEAATQLALAAIAETRKLDAAVADACFRACVPTPLMGDDDSIHLTEFEEGEKRAAFVIRENIMAGKHYD